MDGGDVATFHRFARAYDLVMPLARVGPLGDALRLADLEVERVVDVAGGPGRAVRTLDTSERVVVDAAAGMVRQARARGLDAVLGDARRLPVGTDAVDAVVVVDALHHVVDARSVVAEAARVLRPGGVLVVREFDPTTLRGRVLAGIERLLGFESRFWTPDDVASMVTSADLDASILDSGVSYTVAGLATGRERPPAPVREAGSESPDR